MVAVETAEVMVEMALGTFSEQWYESVLTSALRYVVF